MNKIGIKRVRESVMMLLAEDASKNKRYEVLVKKSNKKYMNIVEDNLPAGFIFRANCSEVWFVLD